MTLRAGGLEPADRAIDDAILKEENACSWNLTT